MQREWCVCGVTRKRLMHRLLYALGRRKRPYPVHWYPRISRRKVGDGYVYRVRVPQRFKVGA